VKVNKYLLPLLGLVMLVGSVLVAQAMNSWITVSTTTTTISGVSRPDPAGIMGSMSLQYVADTYGVPLDKLYTMIGLPASQDPQATLKSLKSVVPTFETESVRTGIKKFYEATGVKVGGGVISQP
jgi:hypothetical protein